MADDASIIRLAALPRRWFRIAAVGCVALGVVMAALVLLAGAYATAAFFLVFTLTLAALAHGIARSSVVLAPDGTLVVVNGYRTRSVPVGDVERVDVVRANERSAPRRVSLALTNGTTVTLVATDGAARSGAAVEALADRIRAFVGGAPTD
jgi:hypothetical protein